MDKVDCQIRSFFTIPGTTDDWGKSGEVGIVADETPPDPHDASTYASTAEPGRSRKHGIGRERSRYHPKATPQKAC